MGKRHIRAIVLPKRATVALLVLTSVLMLLLLWFLSGKAYAGDAHPVREVFARLLGWERQGLSRDAALAFLLPVLGNVLLFVPWGFLLFLALDTPERPRVRSYAITLVGGIVFALAMFAWQHFLPSRVTMLGDALANGLGALTGAALGHARKRVYVRFDF
jgi:glycopeptide antibiotics resistance protein